MAHQKHDYPIDDQVILPAQFFNPRPKTSEPVGRFALALLEGALTDLRQKVPVNHPGTRQRAATEARLWFRSASREPGSFAWVCEILDLNPELMRRRLR